jgi:hypothetical protein
VTLTSGQYAVTTARVNAIRVGTARVGYAPRCTDTFTPAGVEVLHSVARYPCHKRRYPVAGGHTAVLR